MDTLPFGDLLANIAAKTPSPGGGAVASAAGALGAALAHMVVAYSLGKKALVEHQPALESAARCLTHAQAMLVELAEEDAAAYARLNSLSKLPEADPDRVRAWTSAVQGAIDAPLNVAAACCDILRLLETMPSITNRHLRSDLAIAAILTEAAARSARWNVDVNLTSLADREARARIARQLDVMLAEAALRSAAIEKACAAP